MSTLNERRSDRMPIILAIGIFAALSTAASITSEGFLEADACSHYLYARFAFQFPHYFVNIWGRPACTGIYAIPAYLGGRTGVHVMSLAIAVGCGLVACQIARNYGFRWPVLALIFTLAQPLVFLHSFSELTELPFALLVALAFWMYQTNRWLAMAIIMSITPLSRPEGFGFIVLAGIALIVHRRWWWLLILPIPLILWNFAGWIMYGREGSAWLWLIDEWPWSKTSMYEPGHPLKFVALMPAIISPFIFPAMCIGIWRSVKAHWVIAAIPLLILFVHSALHALGKMASSGEARYMLVVAPFWALLAALGWEWLFVRLQGRRPILWAGVAALLPIAFDVFYKVVPLASDVDWKRARRATVWYETSGIRERFPRIATAHQGIFYFLDVAPNDGRHVVEWRKDVLAAPRAGTLVIWHPMYAIYNSDANRSIPLDELLAAGWVDVSTQVPSFGPDWHVLLSPTDARGSDARETPHFPSPP